MDRARVFRVGMAGCGTVGCGVGDLLVRDHDALLTRTGLDIRLVRAVVRDPRRSRAPHVPDALLTDDLSALNRDDVDIVVEVIGGTTVAKQVVLAALAAGKDVVTANKALLAVHGPEIYAAARAAGVCVMFEGSCAAGLPVIAAILRGLVANRIDALEGILNGTCNYILTEMLEAGKSFAEALADAQRLGYAEADPAIDINGTDTAHKLAILASLAFGIHVDFASIPVEGIARISVVDLLAGRKLGLACRLLAVGRMVDGVPVLRVRPMFLNRAHPFFGVDGRGNAVSLYGHSSGHVMLSGVGAGGGPTASAVVSDVVEVALGNGRRTFTQFPLFNQFIAKRSSVSRETPLSRFYARFPVPDGAAAIPPIRAAFREGGSTLQETIPWDDASIVDGGPHVVVLTAPVPESRMLAVLGTLQGRMRLAQPPVYLPVAEPFEGRNS